MIESTLALLVISILGPHRSSKVEGGSVIPMRYHLRSKNSDTTVPVGYSYFLNQLRIIPRPVDILCNRIAIFHFIEGGKFAHFFPLSYFTVPQTQMNCFIDRYFYFFIADRIDLEFLFIDGFHHTIEVYMHRGLQSAFISLSHGESTDKPVSPNHFGVDEGGEDFVVSFHFWFVIDFLRYHFINLPTMSKGQIYLQVLKYLNHAADFFPLRLSRKENYLVHSSRE